MQTVRVDSAKSVVWQTKKVRLGLLTVATSLPLVKLASCHGDRFRWIVWVVKGNVDNVRKPHKTRSSVSWTGSSTVRRLPHQSLQLPRRLWHVVSACGVGNSDDMAQAWFLENISTGRRKSQAFSWKEIPSTWFELTEVNKLTYNNVVCLCI